MGSHAGPGPHGRKMDHFIHPENGLFSTPGKWSILYIQKNGPFHTGKWFILYRKWFISYRKMVHFIPEMIYFIPGNGLFYTGNGLFLPKMVNFIPGNGLFYKWEMVHFIHPEKLSIVYTGATCRDEEQEQPRGVPPWHLPMHPSRWFTFKWVTNFHISKKATMSVLAQKKDFRTVSFLVNNVHFLK